MVILGRGEENERAKRGTRIIIAPNRITDIIYEKQNMEYVYITWGI